MVPLAWRQPSWFAVECRMTDWVEIVLACCLMLSVLYAVCWLYQSRLFCLLIGLYVLTGFHRVCKQHFDQHFIAWLNIYFIDNVCITWIHWRHGVKRNRQNDCQYVHDEAFYISICSSSWNLDCFIHHYITCFTLVAPLCSLERWQYFSRRW